MARDTFEIKVLNLFHAARREDCREGSRFDRDRWGNFFLEDWKRDREAVEAAWRYYDNWHSSRAS